MKATVRPSDRGEAVRLHIEGISPRQEPGGAPDLLCEEPTPDELLAASLASCTATAMTLYARRRGWEVGELEVDVDYSPSQRGSPTRCSIVVWLPEGLAPERRDRLMQVGATSGVHRTLEGEVFFEERLELITSSRADRAEPDAADGRRKRIRLLNGLREALKSPQS